jgi:CRISPR-associated protein Cmr3
MPSELQTWLIEPIDPLVMGDGRSIGTVGMVRSRVLPPPSQLAGAVRGQAGSDAEGRWVGPASKVLPLRIWGPLGARLDERGTIADWWLPRPLDALIMEPHPGEPRIRRLLPLSLPEGCAWGPEFEHAVGMTVYDPRKPAKSSAHWNWKGGLLPWLRGQIPDEDSFQTEGPADEPRTHVAIGPADTALDGALFGVTGRRFAIASKTAELHPWGAPAQVYTRLALAFRTDAELPEDIVRPLGGERRLAFWRRVDAPWPEMPPEVLASVEDGFVRLYLATSAWFRSGHQPDPAALFGELGGEVVAGASGRPEVVSGWDMAARPQRPKPTRRLVPAGSVFFLKLAGDPASRRAWAERTWLAPVSDDDQARRDGFGLALLGTWDGHCPIPTLGGTK